MLIVFPTCSYHRVQLEERDQADQSAERRDPLGSGADLNLSPGENRTTKTLHRLVLGHGWWFLDTTLLPHGLTPKDALPNFGVRVQRIKPKKNLKAEKITTSAICYSRSILLKLPIQRLPTFSTWWTMRCLSALRLRTICRRKILGCGHLLTKKSGRLR